MLDSCGWPGPPPGSINKWRAIETWTDNYKPFFEIFMQHPPADIGDLTHMKQLRADLKCKDFEWFVDNVYPEGWLKQITGAKFQVRGCGGLCVGGLTRPRTRL